MCRTMADRVGEFLASLDDPSRYVAISRVPVFDEHTDVVWVKDGKQVPAGTRGARKVVHKFDKTRLEKLARNCNARVRTGDLAPLAIGHTDPDEPDERKQPDLVGYAVNYAVGYDERRQRHMLYADYRIAREHYARAKTFPRTSVELWPDGPDGKNDFIDPISLIRRTPQRDLGVWAFNRAGSPVLRYSMEYSMTDHDLGGTPPAEPTHDEKMAQFMRHVFSHPHARSMCDHYAMDAEPSGDPTEFPSADVDPMQHSADSDLDGLNLDDEEPLQNSAFPSATNGGFPPTKKPAQHSKSAQYRKDAESVRFARMERQLAEVRQFARKAAEERDEAEARRIVSQLVNEGYELDAATEVPAIMKLDAAGRERHADHVRRFYRQAPVTPTGRVELAPNVRRGSGPDMEHHERAVQYLRKRPGVSYEEAIEKTKNA